MSVAQSSTRAVSWESASPLLEVVGTRGRFNDPLAFIFVRWRRVDVERNGRVGLMFEAAEKALNFGLVELELALERASDLGWVLSLLFLKLVLQLLATTVWNGELEHGEVRAVELEGFVEAVGVFNAPFLTGCDTFSKPVCLSFSEHERLRFDRVDDHALRIDGERAVFVHHQLRSEGFFLCSLFEITTSTAATAAAATIITITTGVAAAAF